MTALGATVFPGFPEPTNLKWRRDRSGECDVGKLPGFERERRIYDSPIERLRVIVAWEVGFGYHLSISHPSRYPTWAEIRDARYELLPDACTMGMLLPAKADYVNLHPNCFHLHQVADDRALTL